VLSCHSIVALFLAGVVKLHTGAPQVEIPAGKYPVGDPKVGKTAELEAFEIDKYEVSIGEYAEFIKYLEEHPEEENKWDYSGGTRSVVERAKLDARHVTNEVKTFITNAKVRGSSVFKDKSRGEPGASVDVNCPIVGITWGDAYAYAKWRGRDLPTEQEWEAAARGARGFHYPWGSDLDLKRMNSNEGYQSMKPGSAKVNDGFNYWAPVDQFAEDQSESGVVGMAGNVAEWVYQKGEKQLMPAIKGGSFATPAIPMYERMEKLTADDCWFIWPESSRPTAHERARLHQSDRIYVGDTVSANVRSLYIGFRTVKRK
jgi:formylglycine-generating enzyme required for sulfatase activity